MHNLSPRIGGSINSAADCIPTIRIAGYTRCLNPASAVPMAILAALALACCKIICDKTMS
jgi:hypothetical protein